jgi:hypothetical protein
MARQLRELSLNNFYDLEEERLRARLDGVRLALSHAGEKGRVLENEVTAFVRTILPSEYGVSTGFIAHRQADTIGLSTQLDIIIYDSMRSSPLVRYDTCSIFPLEAVYGYIEVKASLNSKVLADVLAKNKEMRKLTQRWYWHPRSGSPPTTVMYPSDCLPIRSFIFSFSSSLGSGRALAQNLQKKISQISEAHLHGVFIGGRGFFSPHRVSDGTTFAEDTSEFSFTNKHALTAFKVLLIKCLATFPRCPIEHSPAIDRYHYDFVELSQGA